MFWEGVMSWSNSHILDKGFCVARALGFSLTLVAFSTVHAQERAFQFGLIGDTGYTAEDIEGVKGLLASINGADLALWSMSATSRMTAEPTLQPVRWPDAMYRREFSRRLRSFRPSSIHSF
jgi:hypothetical protein